MASRIKKRNHVARQMLNDLVLPAEGQMIVRVLSNCGSNFHQVVSSEGEEFLVSMPVKFRKIIWIRRGSYIIVTPTKTDDQIEAEISLILNRDQIRYIKSCNMWPAGFQSDSDLERRDNYSPLSSYGCSEEEEMTGVFNPNHMSQPVTYYDSLEDSDDDTDIISE